MIPIFFPKSRLFESEHIEFCGGRPKFGKKIELFKALWFLFFMSISTQSNDGFLLFQFSFEELVKFVRQIHKTWKICSQRIFTCGEEFVGIDRIKEKIPMIASELISRIRSAWKPDYIRENMKKGLDLPSEVINFPEINEETLITQLLKDSRPIGARKDIEGNDEIFIIVNRKRFTMKKSGGITIEKVEDVSDSLFGGKQEAEMGTSIF